ncbi:DAK2 domain-containing protein (plasmid) [Rhizobium leguminosarum]|nr:DAK2 domain-containing protein [Rhizobium leguminosarum]
MNACSTEIDRIKRLCRCDVETIAPRAAERQVRHDLRYADLAAAEAASVALAREDGSADLWREVVAPGEAGAAATRSMVAVRGRTARLGERSLGHVGPGAAGSDADHRDRQATDTRRNQHAD